MYNYFIINNININFLKSYFNTFHSIFNLSFPKIINLVKGQAITEAE